MKDQASRRSGSRLSMRDWIGIVITSAWLIGVALYTRAVWPRLLDLSPDEGATYCAGIFGPLAFLWLVLGFFQQGVELRNSAEALRLQGEELKNSVEQQRALVEVTREQIDFEKANLEAERVMVRRRSQPRLKLRAEGSASNGLSVHQFFYRLINTGPECSDVVIAFDDKLVRAERLTDSAAFQFSHDPETPFETKLVKVDYTDLLANRVRQEFIIEGVGNTPGHPQRISEPMIFSE